MSGGTPAPPSGIDVLDHSVLPGEKARYVREMFDAIAPRYDLLNTLLSAGTHHRWRQFATRCAALQAGDAVLDVCSGTGAWVGALRQAVGPGGSVIGLDFAGAMLRQGGEQFTRAGAARVQGDASRLPFRDSCFDAVTVAFGIRNVAERAQAWREMLRVLRPGGRVVCLEFSTPPRGVFRLGYDAYARWVMPMVGGAVSGRPDAYAYLPASVARFASRAALAEEMRAAGLAEVRWVDLMFGLVCVHVGEKPPLI